MIILIRHSHDHGVDRTRHKDDGGLSSKGPSMAERKGASLIRKYGLPDLIICSPFRRVRETMAHMLRSVDTEEVSIAVSMDPRIGRYFNSEERRTADIAASTRRLGVNPRQNKTKFKARVDSFIADSESYVSDKNKVVWVITHAIVFKRIAKHYGAKLGHLEFLESAKIDV